MKNDLINPMIHAKIVIKILGFINTQNIVNDGTKLNLQIIKKKYFRFK